MGWCCLEGVWDYFPPPCGDLPELFTAEILSVCLCVCVSVCLSVCLCHIYVSHTLLE